MLLRYQKELTVTPEYLDELNHVNNVHYVAWMQDVAVEHSTVNGWGNQRYLNSGACWFVRQHTVNYLHPILLGETVQIETWVEEMQNVSCLRKYRFLRKLDGLVYATAETKWGFVNLTTGRLTKIPEELKREFVKKEKD